MIRLTGLPIPCTINKQLTLARGRFIKSSDAKLYDLEVLNWRHRNGAQWMAAKQWVDKNWTNGQRELKVNLYFCWPKSKLVSKDGNLKRIDTNNRVKSAIDKIAEIIGVDDQFIVYESAEKIIADDGVEELIATIELARLRAKEEFFNSLK